MSDLFMTQSPTYERPPDGLGRGRFPAPAWLILGLAVVVVIAAIAYATMAILRRRAAKRGLHGPVSGGRRSSMRPPPRGS